MRLDREPLKETSGDFVVPGAPAGEHEGAQTSTWQGPGGRVRGSAPFQVWGAVCLLWASFLHL